MSKIKPEPLPLPDNYIDPGHSDHDRELLEIFYVACRSEGGTADEITLRGIKAALAHPTPQPPAAGEVAQLTALVALLRDEIAASRRWEEWFDGTQQAIIAKLLQHLQPVAVAERPWEREGWCDAEGRCWIFMPDISTDPSWRLTDPRDVGPYHTHSLPAHALPTPHHE